MFRDLKEYQEITKIYQDSVHIPEEERIITQILQAENFTQEELEYIIENFDEVYDNQILTEEFLDEMEGEYLEEMAVVKKAVTSVAKKIAPKAKKVVKKVVEKGNKQLDMFKDTAKTTVQNVKPVVKKSLQKVGNRAGESLTIKPKTGILQKGKDVVNSAVSKFKSGVKNIIKNPTVQKVTKGLVKRLPPLALAGGLAVGAKKLLDRGKKTPTPEKTKIPSTDEIRKNNPNVVPGTRVNEIGQKSDKPSEGDFKKDFPDKKPEKKMHSIEKKNRARLGDEKVDALKAKNADFKLMRKGTMSKDDFIKKYPKSITAQKAKGLRDHKEWDAYDMVLEYLYSTEQVSSLEEANYVMMEMEQKTIGEIVKEVKEALSDKQVNEGIKTKLAIGGLMALPFAMQKIKDKFDPIGNKRKEFQQKKKEKYEKQSGTQGQGYFD